MWQETVGLRFCLLNAENLFLLFDKPPTREMTKADETEWQRLSTSIFDNKPLHKAHELARTFKDINPDILMLCEVGGIESLKNFNDLFLNSEYSPILIEGNSDRHIDIGFLIRKGLPFYFDLLTNKKRPINEKGDLFSRDIAELRLFKKDSDKPFFIALLAHLKSRLDPEKKDPNGFEKRKAELSTLVQIYQECTEKNPTIPILICGDFNGNASSIDTDEEFKPIYEKTELKDVLEISAVPPEYRATFYFVKTNGRSEGRQIDYCFLNPNASQHLKAGSAKVYRYKDEFEFAIDAPQNLDAKLKLPSDHYPIVFDLETLKIW